MVTNTQNGVYKCWLNYINANTHIKYIIIRRQKNAQLVEGAGRIHILKEEYEGFGVYKLLITSSLIQVKPVSAMTLLQS